MELSPSCEVANCAATQEFPTIIWNRRFITMFTRALHWSLSLARSIESIPSLPISLKGCIDCARLPREAMFVALPRKVDTMLPRYMNTVNKRTCLPRTNSCTRQPRAIDTQPKIHFNIVHPPTSWSS
jgi:hypothetical protein